MTNDLAAERPSQFQNAMRRWEQLTSRPSVQHTCLLLAVVLAIAAQRLADERTDLPLALGMFLVGAVAFAVCMHRTSLEAPAAQTSSRPVIRTGFLIWAVVFAAFAFVWLKQNHFTAQGLIAWLLSMGLCLVALGDGRSRKGRWSKFWQTAGQPGLTFSWSALALIAAVAVGAALRFYDLRALPSDLGWDLPYNYTDAERILRGEHLIFFPDNYGREGMFFYLTVAVSKLMPLSPYSIRITSALVGIATIPAIYLLAEECFGREAASYAALLLAFSRWHVTLTRSGYRVSLMPLFCILALYGATRVLRRGQARDWVILGLALGLGLWTYKAFAFAVATILGTLFIYACLKRSALSGQDGSVSSTQSSSAPLQTVWRHNRHRSFLGLGIIVLVMVIAAVPMIRVVVDTPKAYIAREGLGNQLVSESLEREGVSRAQLYLRNIGTSVLMFNYKGDGNARFGVPFQRHLGFVSAVLFVFGVALALSRLRHGGNGLLLLCLPGLIAPMTVSMLWGEVPNCFRSSGVIGPSLVLAALALVSVRSHLSQALKKGSLPWIEFRLNSNAGETRAHTLSLGATLVWVPLLVAVLAIGLELQETKRNYFVDFRRVAPRVENYSMSVALSERMIAFRQGPAVVKVWPHWYDGRAVRAHLAAAGRTWDGEYVIFRPDQPPLQGFRGQMLVLTHPEDGETLKTLEEFFPRRTVVQDRYPSGEVSLVAFYGER